MSLDDRRMKLTRSELSGPLNGDVIRIIVEYAQYTETEKVRIALRPENNSMPRRFYYNPYSGMMSMIGLTECMEIENVGLDKFSIVFTADFVVMRGAVLVTIEDLLPSKKMSTIDVSDIQFNELGKCAPKYIKAIQAEIDKI